MPPKCSISNVSHSLATFGIALVLVSTSTSASAQDASPLPNAPGSRGVVTAQVQTPSPAPTARQSSAAPKALPVAITIEQALDLAKRNNPALRANHTLISQNNAQEITANLRPNPVLVL